MLKDRGFIFVCRVPRILGFITVTINQCPTVLFCHEIFNYNLIKGLDIVGLGCVHARCSCGLELCLKWMTGILLR